MTPLLGRCARGGSRRAALGFVLLGVALVWLALAPDGPFVVRQAGFAGLLDGVLLGLGRATLSGTGALLGLTGAMLLWLHPG